MMLPRQLPQPSFDVTGLPFIRSPALPDSYRHLGLDEVDSTNKACLKSALEGDIGRLWITADAQLSGKGSRGRNWISESGNLYASLLLKEPGDLKWLHTLTFVASLAVRDAILPLSGAALADVGLKWPNDVLINGAKCSGILLESHEINGARYVVIGIGLNIAHSPPNTLYKATSLIDEGLLTTLSEVFQQLAFSVHERLAQWDKGAGFSTIRRDWLSAAAGLGNRMEVRLPGNCEQSKTGIFDGIDEYGLLRLINAGGHVELISVADIFFD